MAVATLNKTTRKEVRRLTTNDDEFRGKFISWNLADLSYVDIREYLEAKDTVLVPMASTEQHGPHGPLLTDVLIPNEIGERDLPLPFCVQTKTAEGHEGAENCGRIEKIQHIPFVDFDRAEEFGIEPKIPEKAVVIWGEGTFDRSQYADEALRMIENGADVSLDIPRDRIGIFDPETLEEIENAEETLGLEELLFGDYLQGVLPTLSRRNSNALPDKLFRNTGNFVFEEVVSAGVENTGWAQSIGHLDFDGDGWEDLICGNDFGVNAWYRNLGNGKFEDVSSKIGADKPSYTMNVGITDLNRDGFPDVYISNIVTMDKDEKYVLPDTKTRMKFNPAKMANMRVVEANDLWTSSRTGGGQAILPVQYEQSKAIGRGFSSTGWSWGAQFFDYDNDGDDDLYLVNGMNEYAVYSSVNPYLMDPAGNPAPNAILPWIDAIAATDGLSVALQAADRVLAVGGVVGHTGDRRPDRYSGIHESQ